eukprot:10330860-Alexandrium_andersonii.AAC.1
MHARTHQRRDARSNCRESKRGGAYVDMCMGQRRNETGTRRHECTDTHMRRIDVHRLACVLVRFWFRR